MTTTNRITGTNAGIDVDTVVKQSLTREQNKIDKAYQQQMIYTYQQDQLKEIVNSAQDFYGKYLDILSSGNLLKTSAYETVKFTSTDANGKATTAVTAKGYAGADVGNFSVSISQIAKKASTTLNEKSLKSIIDNGNGVLAVTMKNSEGKDVTAYVDAVFTDGELNMKSTAAALNTELKKNGINVSAKYSEFSKGIILESGTIGEEAEFGVSFVGGHSVSENTGKDDDKKEFKDLFSYKYYLGQNAKGTITKGTGEDAVVYQIDKDSNTVNIDDVQFTFNSATTSTSVSNFTSEQLQQLHNDYSGWDSVAEGTTVTLEGEGNKTSVIKSDSIVTKQSYSDGVTFKSVTKKISSEGFDSTTLDLDLNGESTKTVIKNGIKIETKLNNDGTKTTKVTSNGKTVDFTGVSAKNENGKVSKSKDGITITLNDNGTIEIKDQTVTGDAQWLESTDDDVKVYKDTEGNTVIEKDKQKTVVHTSEDGKTTTKTTTKTYDNGITVKTVTVITKSINSDTNKEEEKSTSKTEILDGVLSDIVKDYEKEPNLKITIDEDAEDRSKDYISKKTTIIRTTDSDGNPIQKTVTTIGNNDGTSQNVSTEYKIGQDGSLGTPETTSSNTEKITLTGETDITSLKDTIVKFVEDYNKLISSINEKLWEKRDKDYMPLTDEQKKEMSDSEIEAWEKKAKTGLLRSDSDLRRIQSSMKSAMSSLMSGTGLTLESIGIEPVDNYTTKNGMLEIDETKLTSALENNAAEVKDLFTREASGDDKGGVLIQLQSVMKSEFKSSDSALSTRIGFSGTSTENNNTLSNYISKQKKLITELKKKYTTKENELYNKYSNLEVQLEKLNSQYNSLTSLLGQ